MLVKFESKSNRVKGLSFHPKRSWVLASLHNGSIQLWDYRWGTIVDKFEEHDGPVRGISFHPNQPLFVSGGDDYKIKVWNYKQRKCLFTLTGHLDYIRTVFFHHEYPWIISASDDQTIRIWNWQNRQCLSVLTGHNHYVMSAQFHPKEDLIVSASLDQTVRVWDISGLRRKHSAPSSNNHDELSTRGLSQQQADMFANNDYLQKFTLDGHERGVNWASFHPTLPLIVSGADDRLVKLWRMSDTKAWEVDTMRGHFNNVSCVLFHPRQELIVSAGEDKCIRVWDMSKRIAAQNFRRDAERFWVLVAHPEQNLFAAGHDNGLIVFKFARERAAHAVHMNSLFYVKDKTVRHYDFQTGNDTAVLGIRRENGLNVAPRAMAYNAAENCLILTNAAEGGIHEIYQLPKDLNRVGEPHDASNECKRGVGGSVVFVARNRYAVLNKATQTLTIKNLNNDTSKSITLTGNVSEIFYAGLGQILMTTANAVVLYDVQEQTQIAELPHVTAKYAYWSSDMSMVALIGKHSVAIASKKLQQLCFFHETVRMKSGTWDDSGIFIYSTLHHIRYVLPQGDKGVIKTMGDTVYLTKAAGKNLYCLDREGKCRIITIDPTEFRFKLALVKRKYDEVLHIIRNSNLVGQSIIAYLRQKGYPEVALHFVKEPRTRFDLALECGNLEVASEMAKTMEQEECWDRLASTAIKQGNPQVVEMAYQRVKNFEKLSFLYVLTGAREKLHKMVRIAEMRSDPMSQFHNSLYLGDYEEMVKVLSDAGLYPLAYSMAKRHGLTEQAQAILTLAGKSEADIQDFSNSAPTLLKPLVPLYKPKEENWPLLTVSRGIFESGAFVAPAETAPALAAPIPNASDLDVVEAAGDWGMDDDEEEVAAASAVATSADAGGGWEIDDDLDLDSLKITTGSKSPTKSTSGANQFSIPPPGPSFAEVWIRSSALAADHAAAGSFESAMQLLNRQVGAVNFEPLKTYFMSLFQSSRVCLSCVSPVSPPQVFPLNRTGPEETKKILPFLSIQFSTVLALLQQAYQATTSGQFQQALELFGKILHMALLTTVSKKSEAEELLALVGMAREYILGLKLEMARRDIKDEDEAAKTRALELAAYFTHCQMQPVHLMLSLQLAMTSAFKAKCFKASMSFSNRLLELGPPAPIAAKARKLLSTIEQAGAVSDELLLEYDALNPFVVCAASLKPMYKGMVKDMAVCTFCGSSYLGQFKGSLCKICGVCEVGRGGSGLRSM